jgi:hypothetical protein
MTEALDGTQDRRSRLLAARPGANLAPHGRIDRSAMGLNDGKWLWHDGLLLRIARAPSASTQSQGSGTAGNARIAEA